MPMALATMPGGQVSLGVVELAVFIGILVNNTWLLLVQAVNCSLNNLGRSNLWIHTYHLKAYATLV